MTGIIAISIVLGIVFTITIGVQFIDQEEMGFIRIMFMLFTITLLLMLSNGVRTFKVEQGEVIKYEEKIIFNKTEEGEFLPDTMYVRKLDK